jgi:hypothetical protein
MSTRHHTALSANCLVRSMAMRRNKYGYHLGFVDGVPLTLHPKRITGHCQRNYRRVFWPSSVNIIRNGAQSNGAKDINENRWGLLGVTRKARTPCGYNDDVKLGGSRSGTAVTKGSVRHDSFRRSARRAASFMGQCRFNPLFYHPSLTIGSK